ncbi:MAG: NTP transferase domain-containing protein [Thaumarchaeota archaeon]|jgi:molybdopterin-guanine dinucleotide biosynthesis protein A|nr:NTP transferase domain-containing protein [Candidatus Terraquivivens yellowstonensis]MCL7392567.1 NTP transferase domain-containing protein [Candidatus Terraquivivens yellowstonensis]MCL7398082.1 NTP transferase domain-containing protein [Candidatus Terraquivivens yellowstonensis]MCL7400178.1 NTP transferase domain-containing protein [Candidatus Terraquivivens yellowstonensis]
MNRNKSSEKEEQLTSMSKCRTGSYACAVLINGRGYMGDKKGLVKIAGRPMIEYVLDSVPDEVTDLFVYVENETQATAYEPICEKYFASLIRMEKSQYSNEYEKIREVLEKVPNSNVLILPCDMPCITLEFTYFLLEASKKFTAVLPRMLDNNVDFSLASYQTAPLIEAFKKYPEMHMPELIKKLKNVLYISTNALRFFDNKLGILYRVSSAADIPKVENILRNRL